MENEAKIKFINFKPSCNDMMESSSHRNIADSIIEIINKTDNGMVIGLEGEYGSGKSTIVEIVEKSISEYNKQIEEQESRESAKKDIFIFKFDAWEHENEALRRVFLEKLIHILKNDGIKEICYEKQNIELDKFKNIVSSKLKQTITKAITIENKYAKIIGLSVLLVPLGVLLKPSDITILSGTIQLNYSLIFLLTIAPFITSLLIMFVVFIKKHKHKNKNYNFFEETIERNEIFSGNDNTSIEFEVYFKCIVICLNKKYKKILIVIDNLDRIDPNFALKIWSTLQIFFKNDNNNIYTLIPFDHDRMKNVWCNNKIIEEEDNYIETSKDIPCSFFDKCFQLIIDVPKPIYSDISVYFKCKANEIFEDKTICDTAELLIRKFNKSNDNIFTPRKINNYLNQIKMLQIRFEGYDIDLKVIAFYAYKRTVENKSAKQLRIELIDGNLVSVDEKYLFDSLKEYEFDFASIIFGVDKKTAKQLLLTEQIRNALYGGKEKLSLIDIYKKNTVIFSKYLHDVIRKDSENISLILKGSVMIKRTIDEGPDELKNILKNEDCIKQFKNIFSDNLSLPWPDAQQEQERGIEQYVNFVELISQDKEAIEKFHKLYIKAITTYLKQNVRDEIIKSQALVKFIKKVMPKYMSDNKIEIEKIEALNESWFNAILMDGNNLEVFKYILPEFDDDKVLELFREKINDSTYAINIINYLVLKNLNNYGKVIDVVVDFHFKYSKLMAIKEIENVCNFSLKALSNTNNFEININKAIEKIYDKYSRKDLIGLINDMIDEFRVKFSLNIENKY